MLCTPRTREAKVSHVILLYTHEVHPYIVVVLNVGARAGHLELEVARHCQAGAGRRLSFAVQCARYALDPTSSLSSSHRGLLPGHHHQHHRGAAPLTARSSSSPSSSSSASSWAAPSIQAASSRLTAAAGRPLLRSLAAARSPHRGASSAAGTTSIVES